MITLRCTNQDGVVADLDVLEQIDIKVDMSAIEVGEIGEVFGVSSQTFSLPATKNNQNFFGYLDELSSTPATGFIQTIPCQVLNDGIAIFTGKLFIQDIITNSKGDSVYQVVVVNETVDFSIAIKNLQVQDLDFSNLDHSYTYGNITGSWNGNLFGGDVVYPMVNYGVDPDNATRTEIAAGGQPGKFDNSITPLTVKDFKPAIRAKVLIDKIMEATGFSYTSSFIEGSYFQDLYVLSTQDDKPGSSFTNPISQSFQAYQTGSQSISPSLSYNNVQFPAETFDNANNFASNTFTAGEPGNYTFYSQLQFRETTTYGTVYDDVRVLTIAIAVNGLVRQVSVLNLKWQNPTAVRTITLGPIGLNLQLGDTVTIKAKYSNVLVDDVVIETNSRFEGVGPSTVTGGTVTMGNIFDPKTKVVDILKGFTQKFNLVVEPVVGARNLLSIEPFNTWVDLGTTVDWTSKVDRNTKFKIEHPLQTQPKVLKFQDIKDTDPVNQYNIDNFDSIYGEYVYTSESDIAAGEKTIGTFFAPTPYKGIAGAPLFVIPELTKREQNKANSPFKFKARLLHNLGLKDNPVQLRGKVFGTAVLNPGNYWFLDENSTLHLQPQYCHFSHLSAFPADFLTTQDLHFGNNFSPGHWPYHQPEANGYTVRSAFYDYWSFYVNEIYDVDARLLTCNVIIDPTELPDLKLNSKIFIDGNYYRINKINGASLIDKSSVEVTLLKTAPRKNRYPRRRIWDRINGQFERDIVIDRFNVSGAVIYNDYNTGEQVTGSVIYPAALLDGLQPYVVSGSTDVTVVWDTPKVDPAQFANNSVLGNSVIDPSADKVQVSGDLNTIGASVANSSVQGNSNQIDGDVSFATVIGENNLIEAGATNITILGGAGNTVATASDSINIGMVNTVDMTVSTSSYTNVIGGVSASISNGSYQTVIGAVSKSLDLSEYKTESTIIGTTYLDDALYFNKSSLTLQLSASQVYNAYEGEALNKYVYNIDWNGADGNATIYLPDIIAQQQIGRTILFKTSPEISATRTITIESSGSVDNIEDGTNYVLNQSSSFVELRAGEFPDSGSEVVGWQVINSSQAVTPTLVPSASLALRNILTASISDDTLTFDKGNGDTFNLIVNNTVSASYALSSSYATSASVADSSTSSSYALTASYAENATAASITASWDGVPIVEGFTEINFTGSGFTVTDAGGGVVNVFISASTPTPIPTTYFSASGGTITTDGDYRIHTFTSSSTFSVFNTGSAESGSVDYLVVAGGGGGGQGGGGAGGVVYVTGSQVWDVTTYTITVGAGGNGRKTSSPTVSAANGNASAIVTIASASGGGYGDYPSVGGANGGSGGGGRRDSTGTQGSGIVGQGNDGGSGAAAPYGGAGGGGGAGAAGNIGQRNGTAAGEFGGNGGVGKSISITGTAIYYGGGGGGCTENDSGTAYGLGGNGGGGVGNCGDVGRNASNGTDGLGGGGGGDVGNSTHSGNETAGSGGDGVVIIRYKYQN